MGDISETLSVNYDQPVNLTVPQEGLLSVNWWFNGELVIGEGRYTIDPTSYQLAITNVVFEDLGIYQAEIMTINSTQEHFKNIHLTAKGMVHYKISIGQALGS